MPKVSFILPAYKRRFLKDAIDSILAQTCRDFELVVVDDKSPEGLYEIIKECPWEKSGESLPNGGRKWNVDGISIRYYQNEENMGGKDLVAAWNHAMEYATGEWCVLASDDDVYMPDFLAEMLRLEEKYPESDLFHCRLAVIDAEGRWLRTGQQWSELQGQILFTYAKEVKRFETYAAEFLFRRTRLDDIGGFVNFPLAIYSDDATWMQLAKNGVACSSEVLFCWRASGENICTRFDNVLAKHQAAILFKEWFKRFSAQLAPTTKEESLLCKDLESKVEQQVDMLAEYPVGRVTSFQEWLRLLRASPLPWRVKRRFIYNRFPRLRAIRMLLPHFSCRRRQK